MNQQKPIKLYGISRRHNPRDTTQIEEHTFKILRSDEQTPSISQQNAVRFISWMHGWNFIRIENYPEISRSDVLCQIKDYVENNTTSVVAGEEVDTTMGTFVKEILNMFTSTIDSLSTTFLSATENPSIRLAINMHMPPISIFELIQKILHTDGLTNKIFTPGNIEAEQLCIPRTSEDMLKRELEYFAHMKEFRPYTNHLTGPYLVMYKILKDNPNAPLEQVFDEAMLKSHELTFTPNTNHKGISLLKAEIADYINSLEIAVQVPIGNERDHHFEIIRKQLVRHMYNVYQLFVLYKNFEQLKTIDNIQHLHATLDYIFTESGNLLMTILQNPAIAKSQYDKHITEPMNALFNNVQVLHLHLCDYLQFKVNNFGYPYSMVDIISGHLFQIMLLLMAGVDQNTTTKLCIHTFGSVIVDMFFQRLMINIWERNPPISVYTSNILAKFRPIQAKYKINQLSQLSNNQNAKLFQDEIKKFIENEKLDNTFFDFLLTFKFSPSDRHTFNIQSFARKIKSEYPKTNIQPQTFGVDIREKIYKAIAKSQAALNHMDEQKKQSGITTTKSIYLYDRSIIAAVVSATGVEEFAKCFNGGSLYQNALSALLLDNSDGN